MAIVAFTPYGISSEESGLIALLANYLRESQYQISSLVCNGLFSLCDRDAETNWRRGLKNCFNCMREQRSLALWGGLGFSELSSYLSPDEVLESKRWALSLRPDNVFSATYDNYPIYEICQHSLRMRVGSDYPDLKNQLHEDVARRLMVSAVRMLRASRNYLTTFSPQVALVAGGNDFLTNSFLRVATDQGVTAHSFRWDITHRCVVVRNPKKPEDFSCPLVFEDITSMRSDTRTWPRELVRMIEDVLVHLDISGSQLALPLAQ